MAIARSLVVMLGTSKTVGVTIATTATSADTEIDILGDNVSAGWGNLFLKYTGTTAAGTIDTEFHPHTEIGEDYKDQLIFFKGSNFVFKDLVPINGTERVYLGTFHLPRRGSVTVRNDAIGTDITNVYVVIELFKMS